MSRGGRGEIRLRTLFPNGTTQISPKSPGGNSGAGGSGNLGCWRIHWVRIFRGLENSGGTNLRGVQESGGFEISGGGGSWGLQEVAKLIFSFLQCKLGRFGCANSFFPCLRRIIKRDAFFPGPGIFPGPVPIYYGSRLGRSRFVFPILDTQSLWAFSPSWFAYTKSRLIFGNLDRS